MKSVRSNSLHNTRMGGTMSLESDTEVMTRDADLYVRKIELEVKKLHNIKRAHNILMKDRNQRRDRCKILQRNLDASIHKVNNVKNKSLVKQKQHFLKKHDEIMEKVRAMKKEIDSLRKTRIRQIQKIEEGWVKMDQKQEEVDKATVILNDRRETTIQQQEQMYELNARNEEEKENYTRKFDQIQRLMDEEQRKRDLAAKIQLKEKRADHGIDTLAGSFDTASILKRRLQKIILKNKEKVKIMDQYMRSLTIIDNAFNQIKETTGITDIQEIQNTFIKSEEQNHSLLTYVDLLHQQIDHLEDQNQEIDKKINNQIDSNGQKRKELASTPEKVTYIREQQKIIEKKEAEVKQFQDLLSQIQPQIETTLKELAESAFNRDKSKEFEYKDTSVNLNDKTIGNYLGDLEEFGDQILTYQSQKYELPVTSNLLINEIPQKDFGPRIQKPVNINPHHMDALQNEDKQYCDKNTFDQFAIDHIERKLKNRGDMGSQYKQSRQEY